MATTKPGLGKGLEALIPKDFDDSILLEPDERIQKLSVETLSPNPNQPRQHFDKEALDQLSDSIKQYGILQPLVVTPKDSNSYYLVAGERRWRAAKQAGLTQVPVIVRTAKELEQLEMAIVENVQRVDLSPLEQARSIQRLHDQFNMDYETIAGRLGKASPTVINIVRLLGLPSAAQTALREKQITEGHARAILALKDAKLQQELLDLIIKNSWSVRQAEQFVSAHKQGYKTSQKARERVNTTTPETQKLSRALNAQVTLKRLAKGGRLEIAFKNETDLKRIVKRINQ